VRRSELDELLFRNAAKKGARASKAAACARSSSTPRARPSRPSSTTARRARGAPASSSTRPAATRCSRTSSAARRRTASTTARRSTRTSRGAKRLEGRLEGNITIFWFDHGWFWQIPLADGVTSIGAVCWPYYLKSRTKPLPEFFRDTIALCPALAERLAERRAGVRGARHRQLLVQQPHLERRALPPPRRRLRLHRPGVLVGRLPGDAQRLRRRRRRRDHARPAAPGGRRAAPLRPRDAARPRAFSWFIFRVSSPTMREFFMAPQNPLRGQGGADLAARRRHLRQDADLGSIFALKSLYYLVSLGHLGRSLAFWQRRRFNIRDAEVPAS
jgi:hypothetical protein